MQKCLEIIPDGVRLNFMEVCGTHTMAIARMGIRASIGEKIRLISGPGCPVCVTSEEDIALSLQIAAVKDVIITTFGDMMRVPAGGKCLLDAKASGARISTVFSPMNSLEIASENPNSKVVFLGVGFETTSPAIAATVLRARERRIDNFFVLPMMKLVTPALRYLCEHPDLTIDGFILPGHVSTIIGEEPYRFIPQQYSKPCVITGFGEEDIARGLLQLTKMTVEKRPSLENAYSRAVPREGNQSAVEIAERVFEPVFAMWRGIGGLPLSGLGLREEFKRFDARAEFDLPQTEIALEPNCRCGDVILGKIQPTQCPQFGHKCLPTNPLGPCMVSSEGACAAYYKYREV